MDVITEDFFNNFIQPFIDKLELINVYGKHIHNVALLPFCKWKLKIIEDIREIFHKEYKEVKDIIDYYENKLVNYFEVFKNSIDENINEIVKTNDIASQYDTILTKIQTEQKEKINTILKTEQNEKTLVNYNKVKIYSFHTVKLHDVYNGGCEMKIDNVNYTGSTGSVITAAYNIDFRNLYNTFTKQIKDILDTKGIELIAKYRNDKLTEMGYIPHSGNGQIIIGNYIRNNPKTQFIRFIFSNIKNTGLTPSNRPITSSSNTPMTTPSEKYMTADYYKQSLEPILLRTCNRLYEKGYLYNADEPELNGWLKFLKDITDIQVLAPDVKVLNMSFDFYRNTFINDYKKLAMLEIFENRFKKELIRKV